MNNAVLLQGEDWEGLYINGILAKEGHTLNEGSNRVKYFIELAKEHSFDIEQLKEYYLEDEDNEKLMEDGNLPININDLIGDYQ